MKLTVKQRFLENMFQGNGPVAITDIANQQTMLEKNRGLFKITIPEHSSLGFHTHLGESEIYYILKGHGRYQDGKITYEVGPGDAVLCPAGEGHAIENIAAESLELIALVINA